MVELKKLLKDVGVGKKPNQWLSEISHKYYECKGYNQALDEIYPLEVCIDAKIAKGIMRAEQEWLDKYEQGLCTRGRLLEELAKAISQSNCIVIRKGE
jgi:hypothetical protein